jgi:hypothetical protein
MMMATISGLSSIGEKNLYHPKFKVVIYGFGRADGHGSSLLQ